MVANKLIDEFGEGSLWRRARSETTITQQLSLRQRPTKSVAAMTKLHWLRSAADFAV